MGSEPVDPTLSSLIVVLILLLINILLSLGYNVLINAQKTTLSSLAGSGNRRAARALAVSEDATHLLNTYTLSVMLVRFFAAGVIAIGIAPALGSWLAGLGMEAAVALILAEIIVLLLGAAIMLMVGGQIPAAIAAARADRMVLWMAGPMTLLVRAMSPLSSLLRRISDAAVRLLHVQARVRNVTEEEIMTLVDAGQEDGAIETEEKEMIYSIFQLGDTSVREVMVPRPDVIALPLDTPLEAVIQTVLEAGHSRIPVYEDNIDHIRGLLYAKDILKLWGGASAGDGLSGLLRPAYFVPEGKGARTLLQEMQRDRIHLAVIVDEYGGTAGLVTLEDLIEEIIGEVRDEYDQNELTLYRQVSEDEYICNARLDLDDLNRLLDIDLPTDESDTLGGYILFEIGEVPEPGAVLETSQVRLEVLTVDQRRIGEVRVTRIRPAPPEAAPPEQPGPDASEDRDHEAGR